MTNQPNDEVDQFIREAARWREEIVQLRRLALDCGLEEHLKWGLPCYTYAGNNVAIIQPFKPHCALMFFKGVLLEDLEGLLTSPGKNSRTARRIEFTNPAQIAAVEGSLRRFIDEAIKVEKDGRKVPETRESQSIPGELNAMFQEVSGLKQAFEGMTPGRRRAYILHFTGAKQSATRRSRIEKCIDRILEGKGLRD